MPIHEVVAKVTDHPGEQFVLMHLNQSTGVIQTTSKPFSAEAIREHLEARGVSSAEIESRLATARAEWSPATT